MTSPDLNDDDVLLGLLSETLDSYDPIPAPALQAALAACELARVDGELATLVAESAGEVTLVALRDDSDTMAYTFRGSEMTVELEIAPGGFAVGVVTPPQSIAIELEMPSARARLATRMCRSDTIGRFHIGIAGGLCRLRLGTGERAVVTSWFYC